MDDGEHKKAAYRVRIIPALKQSWDLFYKNKKQIFFLGWLPFVLFSLYGLLDNHFLVTEKIITFLEPKSFTVLFSFSWDLVYMTVDLLISTGFVVAIYRYLLINDHEQRYIWVYKRGIYGERTIFKLPWHFKLGEKELKLIVIFFVVSLVFIILKAAPTSIIISLSDHQRGLSTFETYTIVSTAYALWFIKSLAFAALAFLWPAISTKDEFRFSKITNLIKSIKGNIFRVFIIVQLIYAPLFILDQLYGLSLSYTDHLSDNSKIILDDTYLIISNMVFYICLTIDCTFISLIYKNLYTNFSE